MARNSIVRHNPPILGGLFLFALKFVFITDILEIVLYNLK
nr:MAG TPA: hypothetical protein [Caudoviricetes sp.]